ncbi:MAG TPA: efflux RND transporter periplasmic adaptor subunit, partial [Planctomycetota bacterium]|nr:efflux RND transporter periplasmic adaptor subunit [Planctomycetota bacterium]
MRRATRSWMRLNLGAAAAAFALAGCGGKIEDAASRPATAAVSRGPMRITVTEGGSLASAKPVTVSSQMEGRATIIYLVPEGQAVKEGDVIVRLDAAELKEKVNRQEIEAEQSAASADAAKKAHEIQLSQNDSDEKDAELKAKLAELDYQKYLHGDFPEQLLQMESDKKIAEEELKRAEDRYAWSKRLYEKSFITKTELEADELSATKAKLKIQLAEKALDVLNKYERDKQEQKLKAEYDQAVAELGRVRKRAEAEAKKTETDMRTKARTADLAQSRLADMKAQLEKSVILAPSSGFVVYQRQDRGRMGTEPMAEGKQVFEREVILQIPDTRFMLVDVDIHESLVKKVRPGQKATVRIDAISGRVFEGVVTRVSQVPSTANSWMNPDLKTYPTQVEIAGSVEELKPGMNAQVEIQVAELQDAVQAPIQAVHEVGGKAFAYVDEGGKPALRPVEIGMNNGRNVHVVGGLKEGERVFLAAPPGAPALPEIEPTPVVAAAETPPAPA